MERIISIDPGYHTGYAILDRRQKEILLVSTGEFFIEKKSSERLWPITRELSEIIKCYQPSFGVIENTFVNKNPISSLKLGIAKGAAIIALESCGIKYEEVSPTNVRKNILTKGNTTKQQMKDKIDNLFGYNFSHNITDAIAIGINFFVKNSKEEYKFRVF